jgi:integrase
VCALRWRHVDLARGTVHVEQGKTDAAARDVDLQPESATSSSPGGRRRPSGARTRSSPDWEGQRLERADTRLAEQGCEPLPEGLSRTRCGAASRRGWFVEGEDVPYVQAQVGHTDPAVTLGIYAQVVRNGRTSARSRRREPALTAPVPSPKRHPQLDATMEALDAEGVWRRETPP